jgi:hypothetical protein
MAYLQRMQPQVFVFVIYNVYVNAIEYLRARVCVCVCVCVCVGGGCMCVCVCVYTCDYVITQVHT